MNILSMVHDSHCLRIFQKGHNIFWLGDVHDKFTIQSTSKPITYALSLEELGTELVHTYQGREPSGRMFNEIVLDHNGDVILKNVTLE